MMPIRWMFVAQQFITLLAVAIGIAIAIGAGPAHAHNKKHDERKTECARLEQQIKTLDARARNGVSMKEMNHINEKRRKARSRWHELRC